MIGTYRIMFPCHIFILLILIVPVLILLSRKATMNASESLRAAYAVEPPFVFACTRNIKTLSARGPKIYYKQNEPCELPGIDVEFMQQLASTMKLNVELVEGDGYFPSSENSTAYGSGGTLADLIARNQADTSLSMLTLSRHRMHILPRYSLTGNTETLVFMYKKESAVETNQLLALQPFSDVLWTVIVATIVILSLLNKFYFSDAVKARALLFVVSGVVFSTLLGLYDSKLTVFLYAKKHTPAPFESLEQLFHTISAKHFRFALTSNSTTGHDFISGRYSGFNERIKKLSEAAFKDNPPLVDSSEKRIFDELLDPSGQRLVFVTYSKMMLYYQITLCNKVGFFVPELVLADFLVFYYASAPQNDRQLQRFNYLVAPNLYRFFLQCSLVNMYFVFADLFGSITKKYAIEVPRGAKNKCGTASPTESLEEPQLPRSIGLEDSLACFIILGSGVLTGILFLCAELMIQLFGCYKQSD